MNLEFDNLGIISVTKVDSKKNLLSKMSTGIDPFGFGYVKDEIEKLANNRDKRKISLHKVRLCFQVFLMARDQAKFIPLSPVVSRVVLNSKEYPSLCIKDYSGRSILHLGHT